MIEPIMYFGIGFLFASLLGLVLITLVHNRAVRLTIRRLEAATPLSMAEIQADKDQLRAEFAMSTRRLEISVDQLKARTTSQLAELGKKTEAINRLKSELADKSSTIFALEAREKSLRDLARTTEEEVGARTQALHDASRTLSDKEASLLKLTSELGERTFSVRRSTRRNRFAALAGRHAQNPGRALRTGTQRNLGSIGTRAQGVVAAARATRRRARQGRNAGRPCNGARARAVCADGEAEALNRRLQDVETRLGEQGRLLVERDYEISQLHRELESARRAEGDWRAEIGALERRHAEAASGLRGEKALLEGELVRARDERSKLHQEVASMKREAEATWATERVENALLRERINDIATEVAHLTMVLEGPGSPIETILAGQTDQIQAPAPGARRAGASAAPNEGERGGNLVERIRALQARASRIAPAS